MFNCCGCETKQKNRSTVVKNVTRERDKKRKKQKSRRRISRSDSVGNLASAISPFHRSMAAVRMELSRKNIDHTKLKVSSLIFVDPKNEKLFRKQ